MRAILYCLFQPDPADRTRKVCSRCGVEMGDSPRRVCLSMPDVERPRPRWVSTAELAADAIRLCSLLPLGIRRVIGVARSGLIPAAIVAANRHVPLWSIDQEGEVLRECGHGWRLWGEHNQYAPPADGIDLVVDDTCGSGRSLSMTRTALSAAGVEEYVTAAVYCNPETKRGPDLYASSLTLPHLLEWNFANSIVGQASAFDIDGILFHDEQSGQTPGLPLWLPRREPAYLITGRREQHREGTLRHLEAVGVAVRKLVMRPDDETRPFGVVKAEQVRAFREEMLPTSPGAPIFWESCPHQAQIIGEESGCLTVCPAVGGVYGPEGCWL